MMNVPLLRKIQEVIAAKPEEFDINSWHAHGSCNTTHCIGGWSQVLSGAPQNKRSDDMADLLDIEFVKDENVSAYYEDEMEVVHTSDDCQAGRLFYVDSWPEQFQHCDEEDCEYHPFKDRSEAAIARIDHFIATEGRE